LNLSCRIEGVNSL